MQVKERCRKNRDQDFDVENVPKRSLYKKIKLKVKLQMIREYYEEKIRIPDLTKRHRLSYSTISHILKAYKADQSIFDSKKEKVQRPIKEEIKQEFQEAKECCLVKTEPIVNIQPTDYYPFAAYNPYFTAYNP